MSPKFRVDLISLESAREIWRYSPQATAFTNPDVLNHCAEEVDWWGAWRSEDLVAAWPVCRNKDASPRNPTFLYYVGPIFGGEIQTFKYHRFQAIRQQALDLMIPRLVEYYRSLKLAMPPGETDIRAFEWWGRDQGERATLALKPRHTARIHELGRPLEMIRNDFARNRKRDLRMRISARPVPAEDWHLQELVDLHNQPIQRQGIEVSGQRVRALSRVIDAATNGSGTVLAWRDPDDGHLASFILMLYGRKEANDILCVASETWRNRGLAGWTTWQGIKRARAEGKTIFDFNGANSPMRAADKHSFNARAELYFNISCELTRD